MDSFFIWDFTLFIVYNIRLRLMMGDLAFSCYNTMAILALLLEGKIEPK